MKKIIIISIFIFSLLGLLKIFSIVPFNRMAGDDYSSALMGKLGIWQDVKQTYMTFMGRFSAVLFETPFSTNLAYKGSVSIYSLVTFILLITAIYLFLKRTVNLKLGLLTSITFFTILYQLTPNKQESWYWLTGSIVYLWPIIIFLFSLSIFFTINLKKYYYLLLTILSFLSAGFNETFSLFTIFISLILLVYFYKNDEKKKLAIHMLCSTTLAFSIMYLSPGNEVRKGSYGANPMSLLGSILYSISEGPKYYFQIIKNNFLLVVSSVLSLSGYFVYFNNFDKKEKVNSDRILSNMFIFLILGFILSIIYMLPSFVGLGRVQPDRSATSLSFIILVTIFYLSYNFAKLIYFNNLYKNLFYQCLIFVSSITFLLSTNVFSNTIASDFYIAKNYAKHFDTMITKFIDLSKSGNMEDVKVCLPDSGLVAEMIDPVGVYTYKNLSLSQYYNIGKVISIKHEEN